MSEQIPEDGWQVIGHVAVDTGHIVISDPCNAHDAANAWDAHMEAFNAGGEWNPPTAITNGSTPGEGAQVAVFATTGIGDGYYEVKARYICGDVAEVRIVFIDLDGLDL